MSETNLRKVVARIKKRISLKKLALALLALGLASNLGSLILGHFAFQKAKRAYQEVNCPLTILHSERVIKAWRIIRIGNYTATAQDYKKQCVRFQAALDLEADGRTSEAIVAYNNFLIRYEFIEGNLLAKSARERIKTLFEFSRPKALEKQELCESFNLLESSDLIPKNSDWAPLYLSCARMLAKEDFFKASLIYEKFVAAYPNHSLVSQAKTEWADLMVVATQKAEEAGELPPVKQSGRTKDGKTILVITNESPLPMRIFLSGPDSRVEELGRCSSCFKHFVSPKSCSGKGTTGTYTISPGQYDVVTQHLDGEYVTPFRGTWELKASAIHSSCFFIVTKYKP